MNTLEVFPLKETLKIHKGKKAQNPENSNYPVQFIHKGACHIILILLDMKITIIKMTN